jgi:hypothetical protein
LKGAGKWKREKYPRCRACKMMVGVMFVVDEQHLH